MKSKLGATILSIGIAVLCIAILSALFLFFIDVLLPLKPAIRGNDFASVNGTVLPGDDEEIYRSLHGYESDNVKIFHDLSPDEVKILIGSVSLKNAFCWNYADTVYSSSGSISENGILKYSEDAYKIEIYEPSGALKNILTSSDQSTVIQHYQNGILRSTNSFSSESDSLFREAGVPDPAVFYRSTGDDFTFSLIQSSYGTLLYAEFASTLSGKTLREEYYISLDYGLVVRADCYENEKHTYSLETVALYEMDD